MIKTASSSSTTNLNAAFWYNFLQPSVNYSFEQKCCAMKAIPSKNNSTDINIYIGGRFVNGSNSRSFSEEETEDE